VIHRLLVLVSIACCGLVLASFALFARDQLAGASKHQQTEIVAGNQVTSESVTGNHAKGQPGKFIDGAASELTSPFRALIKTNSVWVLEIVPTLLALLVYGVGLGYLARYTDGLS
jgi:hypothetical protein